MSNRSAVHAAARTEFAERPANLARVPRIRNMQRYGDSSVGRALSWTRQLMATASSPLRVEAYSRSASGRTAGARLAELHNVQAGQVGVIVCNGPSLKDIDFSLIGDHPYILMNRGYLIRDRFQHPPVALCAHDPQILENFGPELAQIDSLVVTTVEGARRTAEATDSAHLRVDRRWKFARRLGSSSHHGGTVTFWALELAYHLGWSKALIIGMDHRYSTTKAQGSLVSIGSEDSDHFVPSYFAAGMKVLAGDVRISEFSYALADAAFAEAGRAVIDCTVGGACPVFVKGDLAQELGAGPLS